MSHVIWHCNGVGPVEYTAPVEMPFYANGLSTYNWLPPHDMSKERIRRIDAELEELRQKQLRIIAHATGGEIYGDGSAHYGYGQYPHNHTPPSND